MSSVKQSQGAGNSAETNLPKPYGKRRSEKTAGKGDSATPETLPKPVGFGNGRDRRELARQDEAPCGESNISKQPIPIAEETLEEAVDCAVTALKARLTKAQLKAMDRQTKKKAVSLFSSQLPGGRPGQKTSQRVQIALRMRKQGKLWKEIYPIAIPNWANLSTDEQ